MHEWEKHKFSQSKLANTSIAHIALITDFEFWTLHFYFQWGNNNCTQENWIFFNSSMKLNRICKDLFIYNLLLHSFCCKIVDVLIACLNVWTLSAIVCSKGSPFQKEACLNQGTILVEHSHCLWNGDSCLPGVEVAGWGGGKKRCENIMLLRMLPLSFIPVPALIILKVLCPLVERELQPVTLWDMCKGRGMWWWRGGCCVM